METCPHVEHLVASVEHSILDPSKWLCAECGTTEWVWACLSCSHVACGRLNEKHAAQHFELTKHPLAIEINEKYVFCYVCDEYILGDNAKGDIAAIRSALEAIGTLSLEEVEKEGTTSKLLRSYSHQQEFSRSQDNDADRLITADIHYRKTLLGHVFTVWQRFVQKEKESGASSTGESVRMLTRSRSGLFHIKKRTLIPGVTGLRNLGNTCYINSIIQALSHLEEFREFFCHLVFGLFSPSSTPLIGTYSVENSPLAAKQYIRLNTFDYFQHLSQQPSKQSKSEKELKRTSGGLNGGWTDTSESHESTGLMTEGDVSQAKAEIMRGLSLCQELHGLLRVFWSGKWAQVSPHGFLQAVWKAIPIFKGHSQHDAQEFLCELLDKLSQEIEDLPHCKESKNIVDHSFRGELISQVTCLSCNNVSACYEPFLDLSLEFPPIFQQTNSQALRNMCHVTEMLSKFTDVEDLEPKSYSCDKCCKQRKQSSRQEALKRDARKQLLINKPPEILRLHLKRFRWCGRNHREKINTHVAFDEELDISSFCKMAVSIPRYRLNAVIVHHGAGFRAGHYTTYSYNNDAGFWVHCNDARVQIVSIEEVLLSQAYILFYTREFSSLSLDELPVLDTIKYSLDSHSTISTIPLLDEDTVHTLQQLRDGETEQIVDEEVSLSFHRDPTLIQRLESSVSSHSVVKRNAALKSNDSSVSSSPSQSQSVLKRNATLKSNDSSVSSSPSQSHSVLKRNAALKSNDSSVSSSQSQSHSVLKRNATLKSNDSSVSSPSQSHSVLKRNSALKSNDSSVSSPSQSHSVLKRNTTLKSNSSVSPIAARPDLRRNSTTDLNDITSPSPSKKSPRKLKCQVWSKSMS